MLCVWIWVVFVLDFSSLVLMWDGGCVVVVKCLGFWFSFGKLSDNVWVVVVKRNVEI